MPDGIAPLQPEDEDHASAIEAPPADPKVIAPAETGEVDPELSSVGDGLPLPVHHQPGPSAAPDHLDEEQLRERAHLVRERDHLSRLAAVETEKRDTAAAKLPDAEQAAAQAEQVARNAKVAVEVLEDQRTNAEHHRGVIETQIATIDAEIAELYLPPEERERRDARLERARLKAEAKAAEAAAREAYLNELIEVERTYSPIVEHGKTVSWATIYPSNRRIKIKRRDLADHEAEQADALVCFAKQKRDELADEYKTELRQNGRRTLFPNKIEHGIYLTEWGPNSDRAKAYRERQIERGQSTADPVKYEPPAKHGWA